MSRQKIRIGGASGFWGEASYATAQLLSDPDLDVLVYDYLAEITLSIMARARAKDPTSGYAPDFISDAMKPNLQKIASRGIKVLSNAGGMNPLACADALKSEIAAQGLSLSVAVVEGDDLRGCLDQVAKNPEMFSGKPYPDLNSVLSVNAYLGAGPVVAALHAGADIVLTGRCVDSALALAACMHAFDWPFDDYDRLAAGSLAGHLLECGPQAMGGNFTDWEDVPDRARISYPIAQVRADGSCVISAAPDADALVIPLSVGEQMLYEIGDPQAYDLPDVSCDFSNVSLRALTDKQVEVSGATGRAPTGQLKVSTTSKDGFRAGQVVNFNGRDARAKGTVFVQSALDRARDKLSTWNAPDYQAVSVEMFGGRPCDGPYEEIAVTAAVQHQDARAVDLFLKELIGAALAAPPGLHFFTGAGRPKPSPVVALFSSLVPADLPTVSVTLEGKPLPYSSAAPKEAPQLPVPHPDPECPITGHSVSCRLEDVAVARSGDKGDIANIGVIARAPEFMPWIWAALTPDAVGTHFAGRVDGAITRFFLPGTHSMNIVMQNALGGGGIASLRNDSQGKGYAQCLLAMPVLLPADIAPKTHRKRL
ncbi:MAG: DUF1446 domain-containing protein [Rhodobacteraceae bacterium]|nr:DUF1446 domain-containing protein [Paracoccaceae bacterium]